MPDVHVPHLDDHEDRPAAAPAVVTPAPPKPRGRSFLKIALEVALISVGVFLGLAGEQWRERARQHEMAQEALRRFRTEVIANRKAVAAVEDYHARVLTEINVYFASDAKGRQGGGNVSLTGVRPAAIEHTAWDVALATQSLAYIDPELSFTLAHIYTKQQTYEELTRGFLQAMYLRPPDENLEGFLRSIQVYYADTVGAEPELLKMYDDALPQIDRALAK